MVMLPPRHRGFYSSLAAITVKKKEGADMGILGTIIAILVIIYLIKVVF